MKGKYGSYRKGIICTVDENDGCERWTSSHSIGSHDHLFSASWRTSRSRYGWGTWRFFIENPWALRGMNRGGQQVAIGKSPEHRDGWQNWKFQEDRDCRRQIPRPSRQMDKLGQESTKRKIQRARRSWRSRRVSWALRQWVTWLQPYVFMTSVFVFDFEFIVISERLHVLKSLFVSAYVQCVFLFVLIARNMYHLATEVCFFPHLRVGIRTQCPFQLKVCSDLSRFKN